MPPWSKKKKSQNPSPELAKEFDNDYVLIQHSISGQKCQSQAARLAQVQTERKEFFLGVHQRLADLAAAEAKRR